jgi:hypothetical protein
MGRRRDPNLLTPHLCRFCGERIPWGVILRLLRVDPDQPPFMQKESACHHDCLRAVLRPKLPLTFHRHWNGKAPLPDDDADIDSKVCGICGLAMAPETLVRLRIQRPTGTVKAPEFDEQTVALHFECLGATSNSRLF